MIACFHCFESPGSITLKKENRFFFYSVELKSILCAHQIEVLRLV